MGKLRQVLLSAAGAAAFLVAGIAGASAADGTYNWSGFYIGVHGGGVQSDTDWTARQLVPLGTFDQSDKGFIGGGQVGLQHQFGNVVAGIEISWSGMDLEKTRLLLGENWSSKIDQTVAVTGRLGWAMNRSLFYVKGGWATANVEFSIDHPGLGNHGSSSGWHDGWTLGGGWEYAFMSSLSLGLEYNFTSIDVDRHWLTQGPQSCSNCNVDGKSDIQAVLARLNFKFN